MLFWIVICVLFLMINIYQKYFKVKKIHYLFISLFIIWSLVFIDNRFNYLKILIIYLMLFLVMIVDYQNQWIPDLSIIVIGTINLFELIIVNNLYNITNDYSGIVITLILILLIIFVEIILKKELIGFGDLKLIFVLIINQNILFLSLLLFMSSLIGIIVYFMNKSKKQLPFAPAIVISYILLITIKKIVLKM